MLKGKTVAVVVPAYNEETQIGMVIETMPDFVDRIVIINDKSKDRTSEVIRDYIAKDTHETTTIPEFDKEIVKTRYNEADVVVHQAQVEEIKYYVKSEVYNTQEDTDRIILIDHIDNGGVGAAIARGYKWCKDHNIDCTAVMAGDGQMDPDELESICLPVIEEGIDYVKGNRLIHPSSKIVIPKIRFFGNSILSIFTKIASGYWKVSDTQTGYTAISLHALRSIKIYDIYRSYGMPNDMLVKLNIISATLREIEIKPVYRVGEQSKMKIKKVIRKVSWLLMKLFFQRLYQKYLIRDFHPLFLLYHLSFALGILAIPYGLKILMSFIQGYSLSYEPILAFFFLFTGSFQSYSSQCGWIFKTMTD
ncbi:glycosyltransferase family 2 protein [bacterium SCSIO 12741]|nr:glycosyltransferase family 2 protein [bacterium SCSIO 12741]